MFRSANGGGGILRGALPFPKLANSRYQDSARRRSSGGVRSRSGEPPCRVGFVGQTLEFDTLFDELVGGSWKGFGQVIGPV